ncbi:uncharacterized protein CLUP02_07472 [Colletotrichum lupini]|uniref:Uncharacterized protein n=1 Tax=Colletotrichum lupini TaxID=145971 RepID=A0A9Q8SSF4_9PEZI|nr:uncharacterized protein CLUP02_07472 [Colletotrichum lupini]UQC81986.1 hypothetical protein CLUP02_07472 [Colletotrichum lupini]
MAALTSPFDGIRGVPVLTGTRITPSMPSERNKAQSVVPTLRVVIPMLKASLDPLPTCIETTCCAIQNLYHRPPDGRIPQAIAQRFTMTLTVSSVHRVDTCGRRGQLLASGFELRAQSRSAWKNLRAEDIGIKTILLQTHRYIRNLPILVSLQGRQIEHMGFFIRDDENPPFCCWNNNSVPTDSADPWIAMRNLQSNLFPSSPSNPHVRASHACPYAKPSSLLAVPATET